MHPDTRSNRRGGHRVDVIQLFEQRAAILGEASALLANSPDFEITLQGVARLAVTGLADWCIFDLLVEPTRAERVALACADSEQEDLAALLRAAPPRRDPADGPIGHALVTGQSSLVDDVSVSLIPATSDPGGNLLRQLRITSSIVVPLKARGQILGAMSLWSARPDRRFERMDLALAVELADRAAIAIDNARLQREVQQAVRLRDDFLSAAAHDLKNPITAAKAQLQLMHRHALRAPDDVAEQLTRRIRQLEGTIDKMAKLIDELRDVASIQIGRPLELHPTDVDLVALVENAVAESQQVTRRHRFTIESNVPELVGNWDRSRLDRVIDNLLSNAIKYSPTGGGIDVRLERRALEGADFALVTVCDQGIGIPEPDLPRIFERFHRGANVMGRIAGAGIGLAGAHQIVQQHGGHISVESVEGQGSCFSVWLPLALAEVPVG